MKKQILLLPALFFLLLIMVSGCGRPNPIPPASLIQIHDVKLQQWKTIELRDKITYDEAWNILIDVIAIKWDIDLLSKESGYLRSAWNFTNGLDKGTKTPYAYGRRLSANFNKDRTQLQIKTEAKYQVLDYPAIHGIDSQFNEDIFSEISGKLGRTAR